MGMIISPTDWDDWRWVGQGKGTGASAPARTGINGFTCEVWEFTDGKLLHCDGCQIPHDYEEGTNITAHIHWCPSTSATYTGTWTLKYSGWLDLATGSAMSAETTITAAFNASMTAFQMQSQDFSAVISGTGRKISSILNISLSLAFSAGTSCFMVGFDGHYRKDRLGSKNITSKT